MKKGRINETSIGRIIFFNFFNIYIINKYKNWYVYGVVNELLTL